MKKGISLLFIGVFVVSMLLLGMGCPPAEVAEETTEQAETIAEGETIAERETMRFIMVPLCVHPWFDSVYKGAVAEAEWLSSILPYDVVWEYNVPESADIAVGNRVFQQAAATKPAGLAYCPGNTAGAKEVIEEAQALGIVVGLINQNPPGDFKNVVGVGNDFAEQGAIAAERIAEICDYEGKIAVMHGVPTAQTHIERYNAIIAVLETYPDVEIVDAGFDNDEMEKALALAAATIAANPDLKGFVCLDATGPIGIASAVEEAGKKGEILVVGMDDVIEILEAVESGVLDSTSCTRPHVQGQMLALMLWRASLGPENPKFVDTGVAVFDQTNVKEQLEKVRALD